MGFMYTVNYCLLGIAARHCFLCCSVSDRLAHAFRSALAARRCFLCCSVADRLAHAFRSALAARLVYCLLPFEAFFSGKKLLTRKTGNERDFFKNCL